MSTEKTTETTKVMFGIMLPNGELARVNKSYNGDDRYACGEHSYRLSDHEHDGPVWLTDELENVKRVITEDVRYYNSDEDAPCWSGFHKEDFTPVRVTVTTKIEKLDIEPLFDVKLLLDCRDMHAKTVSLYTGQKAEDRRYVFCCVNYHKADMEKRIGQELLFGSWFNRRTLVAVVDVPEEWVEECLTEPKWKEENGFCALIMTPVER